MKEAIKDISIVALRVFCFIVPWLLLGWLLTSVCFGGVRRNPPRYKVAPTNCVVRIDGTNCYVRYMWDNLLLTNLVVMIEPFDPPPAPPLASTNNVMEVENE